ncbi:hypothetical protein HF086_002317 [Spodoptera exigua]|uniref:Uncharacterized protein n=1 Tax=Spodoptera exigua TaxID=7107 RepID=A0A922SNI0_SPOEX|nr:hypothetical protein HF086_002317 [Spodoptera exigua]
MFLNIINNLKALLGNLPELKLAFLRNTTLINGKKALNFFFVEYDFSTPTQGPSPLPTSRGPSPVPKAPSPVPKAASPVPKAVSPTGEGTTSPQPGEL